METLKDSKTPFSGVLHPKTPEELDIEIAQMQQTRDALRARRETTEAQRVLEQQNADLQRLYELRKGLKELDEAIKISGKLELSEAVKLAKQRTITIEEIEALEQKYGYDAEQSDPEFSVLKSATSVWPTVAKIVLLLFACWGIVVYSGNYILDKYPGAAIYNAVSFQKVLFGFSVFIAEIVGVIVALSMFFPGLGKYFNPFNRDQLDFFTDFKNLSEWQRNVISLSLFFALLLAFVLTVSGKLD